MNIKDIQKQIDELQKELDRFKINEPMSHIDISNWEQDGIVSKSANIIVAPEDYWESGEDGEFGVVDGEKRYFTWDEAMAIGEKLGNGWRLPTPHEMMHLIAEFGLDESGEDDPEKFMKELNFGLNGYYEYSNGALTNKGSNGNYWEGRVRNASNAYYLGFNSTNLVPQYYSLKGGDFSVRLVKDLEEE